MADRDEALVRRLRRIEEIAVSEGRDGTYLRLWKRNLVEQHRAAR